METKHHHGSEDRPLAVHPDEIKNHAPGKEIKVQHKIDIVESGFGRDQGQIPADEHIEERFSQIDEETKNIHVHDYHIHQTENTSGYLNDATSADRDTGNGEDNWGENTSRSARHK